jgi:hypothetical protein
LRLRPGNNSKILFQRRDVAAEFFALCDQRATFTLQKGNVVESPRAGCPSHHALAFNIFCDIAFENADSSIRAITQLIAVWQDRKR